MSFARPLYREDIQVDGWVGGCDQETGGGPRMPAQTKEQGGRGEAAGRWVDGRDADAEAGLLWRAGKQFRSSRA